MYRKFTVTDADNKKITFSVYPDASYQITVSKDEIPLTLSERKTMNTLIDIVNEFMTGNSINEVKVEELT